jgi:hypothetical protein
MIQKLPMSITTSLNSPPKNEYPEGMNSLSIEPLYLELLCKYDGCEEKKLAHGTAFLIAASPNRAEGDRRRTMKFATAGHCLTGRNFLQPEKHLDNKNKSEPNIAKIWLPKRLTHGWDAFDIELLDSEGKVKYKIIEHEGLACDIATFELECTVDFEEKYHLALPDPMCFRRHPFKASTDWMLDSVGCQLLISGFPLTRSDQKFALTIPAVIASEPRFPFEFLDGKNGFREYPFFLVSARTWTGQSGSPVYRSASNGFGAMPQGWLLAAGGSHDIVGIYTSRLHPSIEGVDSRQHSDLGVVWPLNLLLDEVKDY